MVLAWLALAPVGAAAVATPLDTEPDAPPRGVVLRDTFTGPNGVITNHYAMWSDDPKAFRSPTWQVESGSLLRHDDAAWTGVPTGRPPNRESSRGSGSEIFR